MSASLSHGKILDVGSVGMLEEQLPPWQEGSVNLDSWFDPDNHGQPIELEIGTGKGTFLVQHATQLPRVNFIGIEYAKAYWRFAADRCRRHGLSNVKLVRIEGQFFVRNYVPDQRLRQVHTYFPDPWPKKRHHKRRLINRSFLLELHRVLEEGGQVRIVTDHPDYHEWILAESASVSDQFERLPWLACTSARDGELVGTNFERKYRRAGESFHALVLRKR